MKFQQSYVLARVVVESTLAAGMLLFPGSSSGQVAGPVSQSKQRPVDQNPGGWRGELLRDRFDLRLVSWGNASGVPKSGNKLVVIGVDNNELLHIRIFDAGGKRVVDTDETKLSSAQAVAIWTLKHELAGLLSSDELAGAKQARVIRRVRSIVGQTSVDDQQQLSRAQPGKLPRRSRTTGSRSRRDAGSSSSRGLSTGRDAES